MPRLRDDDLIARLQLAFEESSSGGVKWKRYAGEWVRANLETFTQEAVNDLILQHIKASGEVDQVTETREEYRHEKCHFDFRIPILERRVYVETVLHEEKMGPIVTIVNIHDV